MHLSFSLYGADEAESGDKGPQIQWHVLNLFLQSIGIVLTDVQDVIFKYASSLSHLFYFCIDVFMVACSTATGEQRAWFFKLTLLSRPNKVHINCPSVRPSVRPCVRAYVRPSTRRFFNFSEI